MSSATALEPQASTRFHHDAVVSQFAQSFAQGPRSILDPIAGLADLADGVTRLEITGLPNQYGLIVTCTNVHITPILKTMIEADQAHEEAKGEKEMEEGEFVEEK